MEGENCNWDTVCVADLGDAQHGHCNAAALPGELCAQGLGADRHCWAGTCGADGHCPSVSVCSKFCYEISVCVCLGMDDCPCIRPREENQSCAEPLVPCADGLACKSGICKTTDELTRFVAACGP